MCVCVCVSERGIKRVCHVTSYSELNSNMHVNKPTVGGIKTVTFPFRSVPSKRNASSAVCRSITCTPPLHFRSVSVPFRLDLAARDRASDR